MLKRLKIFHDASTAITYKCVCNIKVLDTTYLVFSCLCDEYSYMHLR